MTDSTRTVAGKFHIAVVSPFLDKRHGTERCVAEQVERLASEYGWDVHIYSQRVEDLPGVERSGKHSGAAGEGHPAQRVTGQPPARGRLVWHKVLSLPGPHLFQYIWWFCANHVWRWWDRAVQGTQYDLVYTPGINCLDADVSAVHIVFHEFYRLVRDELRFRKIPLRAWPRTLHRRLYYHLIMALEKRVYGNRRVTLTAVSGLTARELRRFFGREDVHVIPNAVDLETFNPAVRQRRRAEARRRLRFEEKDFVLLLMGNDWKKKGLDHLLEAVSRCRELPLKVLVVGRDERARYQAAIQQLGLHGRVRFEAPSADVVQFYAAADAYAGPSLHDSFALPPAEAMACGLPVITSRNNGGSEMISHGEDGFILEDPADVAALARILEQLCAHQDVRGRVGQNAARVAEKYSWERNAEATRVFLEHAIHSQGRASAAVEVGAADQS